MSGSIHVINVLRILSSRNAWNISAPPFLFLSRAFSLFFLRGETDGSQRFRACKLCSGRVISATTSVSTDESTGWVLRRARKTQRKSGLVFQRANSAFLLRWNQSAALIVVHILEKVLIVRWYTRDDIHERDIICLLLVSRFCGSRVLRIRDNLTKISLHFEDMVIYFWPR